MRESIRLGRVFGVRVGLNVSVLVIVVILVLGLAFGRFPAAFPGLGLPAYIVAGIIAAVLFLGSLLAHELAHAVVARRNGIEVAGITLWLLGGVAQLRGEPRTPGADFRIAVVGPATSVALGIAFGIAAAVVTLVAGPGLPAGVLEYLGAINILLALFNLIPAAPLDGGRVLRAVIWWRRHDRTRAAVAAARAGRVFGFVLIGLGLLQVVLTRGLGGLWLAVIGLFLVNAASAEEQQTQANAVLRGVLVGHVMTRDPVGARPDETVSSFVERVVLAHRHSTYPLLDEAGRLRGLATLNRIRAVAPSARPRTTLAEVACPPGEVPTAYPDEPLTDLLPRMAGCADGRAVVVDRDGRVLGVITPSDISRALQFADLRSADPYPPPHGADLAGPNDHRRRAA